MPLGIPLLGNLNVRFQSVSTEMAPTIYGLNRDTFDGTIAPWNVESYTTPQQLSASALPYLSSEQDAPPYFVQTDVMAVCDQQLFWQPTHWSTCPDTPSASNSESTSVHGVGLAMSLGASNWARTINGVSPEGSAVFWETLYHQQVFSRIALALKSAGPMPLSQSAADKWIQNVANSNDVVNTYYWDLPDYGGQFFYLGYGSGY